MVRATIDREPELESLGVIAQLWEEAYSEGLRQDADRYRQAMLRAERGQTPRLRLHREPATEHSTPGR